MNGFSMLYVNPSKRFRFIRKNLEEHLSESLSVNYVYAETKKRLHKMQPFCEKVLAYSAMRSATNCFNSASSLRPYSLPPTPKFHTMPSAPYHRSCSS